MSKVYISSIFKVTAEIQGFVVGREICSKIGKKIGKRICVIEMKKKYIYDPSQVRNFIKTVSKQSTAGDILPNTQKPWKILPPTNQNLASECPKFSTPADSGLKLGVDLNN